MKLRINPNDGTYDYARSIYIARHHYIRFTAYVEKHGLTCQECRGRGEHSRSQYEPPDYCGWCEGTGKVTRWMRGYWLRSRVRKAA
jgi:RecJ-like exonuclease